MLFFTILRDAAKLAYCTVEGYDPHTAEPLFSKDRPELMVDFYSTELIVATTAPGETKVFHVKEIRSESPACITGYMVEGESQL